MAMSRKDYVVLAQILAAHQAADGLVSDIANWLQNDNPRFSRDRFLEAVKNGG